MLNEADRNSILQDNKKFTFFVSELMPYLILSSLSDYFRESWHIGITLGFDRMSSGPLITTVPVPSVTVRIHEIPVLGNSFLSELSWDFSQILKELFPDEFHLPPDTNITITYKEGRRTASIILTNPAFNIEILTGMLSGGAGWHQKSFRHEIYSERYPSDFQELSLANFLHYDSAGYLSAKFKYPEYDMEEFNKYFKYYSSLKDLLDYNWNFDEARKKHPPKDALIMNDKLDEILDLLRNAQT